MVKCWITLIALGVSALSAIAGCVALPPNSTRSPQGTWESWNRGVYKLNDKLDRAVAKPGRKMEPDKTLVDPGDDSATAPIDP